MKSELITYLVALTIASTLSMLVVLAIRRGVRLVFGAAAAYSTWLLVPAAMLAVLLPAPSDSGSTIGVSIRIALFSTLSTAIDNSPGSSLHTVHPVDWTLWAIGAWVVGAALFVLTWLGFNALSLAAWEHCPARGVYFGQRGPQAVPHSSASFGRKLSCRSISNLGTRGWSGYWSFPTSGRTCVEAIPSGMLSSL